MDQRIIDILVELEAKVEFQAFLINAYKPSTAMISEDHKTKIKDDCLAKAHGKYRDLGLLENDF